MSVAPGISDFLQYEPTHKVLVCKECQYAIQKSALESHLLRHKIYRGQRQRLLSSIGRLDLLEPEDVQVPSATPPPVPNLPVISGYKCLSAGCRSLCASEKRMKRHWSESHSTNINGVLDGTFAKEVHLQTFFRGNKLKYFEVRPPIEATLGSDGVADDASSQPLTEADLPKMRYFHHFLVSTCQTLPIVAFGGPSYWHSDVVAQALLWPWLMAGMLCVAACHLHALSDAEDDSHVQQSSLFGQSFLEEVGKCKEDPESRGADESNPRLNIGAQLLYLRQLCIWAQEPDGLGTGCSGPLTQSFTLNSFIMTIQGCAAPEVALQMLLDTGEPTVSPRRANNTENRELRDNPLGGLPPALAESLRTLPFRMAEVLPRPDSPADFFATVSSLNSLIQCFALSYLAEDAASAWKAMEQWFLMIPDQFAQILRREPPNPPALVILGHWTVLVERAERRHWFLAGSAVKLMREIKRKLPQDGAAQALVSGLLS